MPYTRLAIVCMLGLRRNFIIATTFVSFLGLCLAWSGTLILITIAYADVLDVDPINHGKILAVSGVAGMVAGFAMAIIGHAREPEPRG